ncbi:hypothetical protein GCM10007108_03010 [Thermogymnomonas acidicola]|uniref:Tyr recombinase domain-containing protein n=2 Tax=Thermogymnomonas acidicola TaxID=399579 RepID=A0AA37BQ03_9ARCH|nr:hypothetical protein GCM10007108_03010 [Thermogymnomonas acidicola]
MERDRLVPVPTDLEKDLVEYISRFRMPSDPRALFTTEKGRMGYSYLRSFISRLGARVGIKGLHTHLFRHYYASELYRITGDIRLVQILVRHARIETTTIYEHLTTKEAVEKGKSAVEKLFRGGGDLMHDYQKTWEQHKTDGSTGI